MPSYFVYLVQCADGSFYAGICTDLERRLAEHNGIRKGARYTRARQPVSLVYQESAADRSSALKREYQLRQLSHAEKAGLSRD